jgi:putative phosphoribosyl transferase
MIYRNRTEAGRLLAPLLGEYANRKDTIVLALPRGGLPVADEIARSLGAPLDVLVVRKLGLPWQPELAAGAIAPGGVLVVNPEVKAEVPELEQVLAPVTSRERAELQRRELLYREGKPPTEVRDRIAIVVDDGIATGATMHAAVLALRAMRARSVVVAIPVAARRAVTNLERIADRVICLQQPVSFFAVGQWYQDFPQLDDAEVVASLTRAAERQSGAKASSHEAACQSP